MRPKILQICIVVLFCICVFSIPAVGQMNTNEVVYNSAGINVTENDTAKFIVNLNNTDSKNLSINKYQSKNIQKQEAFRNWSQTNEHIEIINTFWISNKMLVKVNVSQINPMEILRKTNVKSITPNYKINQITPTDVTSTDISREPYALEQLNINSTISEFGSRGDNTRVAVLDTGINDSHPDLSLSTAGNFESWAEFDSNGNRISSEPYDPLGHGTSVSSVVASSNDTIGVAPNVQLIHGKVFSDDGSSSGTQLTAGLEWAVEQNADIIVMSLGSNTKGSFVDVIENVIEQDTIVVASAGNDGEGTTTAPGSQYPVIATGATDRDGNIANFSSGKLEDKSEWSNSNEYWPNEWYTPTIAGPGSAVYTINENGSIELKSGTSFSAPAIAGSIALLDSYSTEPLNQTDVRQMIRNSTQTDRDPDNRYGYGIVDAYELVSKIDGDISVTSMKLNKSDMLVSDTLNIELTIENTLPTEESINVSYFVGDEQEYTQNYTVNSSEIRTVSYNTSFDSIGRYNISVGEYSDAVSVDSNSEIIIKPNRSVIYTNGTQFNITGNISTTENTTIEQLDMNTSDINVTQINNTGTTWNATLDPTDALTENGSLVVTAKNSHNVYNSSSIDVIYDNNTPYIDIQSDNATYEYTESANITVEVEDPNLNRFELYMNGSLIRSETIDTMQEQLEYTIETPNKTIDELNITGKVYDAANNTNASTTTIQTTESTEPYIVSESTHADYYNTSTPFTVTLETENVQNVSVSEGSVSVTDNEYLVTVSNDNRTGEQTINATLANAENETITKSYTYYVDPIKPTIEPRNQSTIQTTQNIQLESIVEDQQSRINYTEIRINNTTVYNDSSYENVSEVELSTSEELDSDGYFEIVYLARDLADNTETKRQIIQVDTSEPQITLDSVANYTQSEEITINGSVTNSMTVTDIVINNTNDDQKFTIQDQKSFTESVALSPGRNQINITATDEANRTINESVSILRDSSKPEINISYDAQTNTESQVVDIVVEDTNSDINQIQVESNNNTQIYNNSTEIQTEIDLNVGNNTVSVQAEDAANNTNQTNITISRWSFMMNPIQNVTNSSEITTGGVIESATPLNKTIRVNDNIVHSVETMGTYKTDIELNNGKNRIQTTVTDRHNNSKVIEKTVTADTFAPEININYPNKTHKDYVTISGNVMDEHGNISNFELYYNEKQLPTESNEFNTTVRLESENTIHGTIMDNAGNVKNFEYAINKINMRVQVPSKTKTFTSETARIPIYILGNDIETAQINGESSSKKIKFINVKDGETVNIQTTSTDGYTTTYEKTIQVDQIETCRSMDCLYTASFLNR